MLFIAVERIRDTQVCFEHIGNRVETAVSVSRKGVGLPRPPVRQNGFGVYPLPLPVMGFGEGKIAAVAQVCIEKQLVDFGGLQLLVPFVRHPLDDLGKSLFQAGGQFERVPAFQHIPDAPFARLAVDADDVLFVFPADVPRIDGEIGHVPRRLRVRLPPFQTLGDGVLMRAGKRREHEFARIRLPFGNAHPRQAGIHGRDVGKIFKIQPGIHPLRIQVEGEGHEIDVARPLAVAEQGAFHPFRPREQPRLRRSHGAAAVVVRMHGQNPALGEGEMLAHVLHLPGKNVGHCRLHRRGQIDDRLFLRRRRPDFQNGVAHLRRKFRLRGRETLGRIFEADVPLFLLREFLHELRARRRNRLHLFPAPVEHLFALGGRDGIVEVHHDVFRPLDRLKGAADDMLPRLGQNLHRHVVRDKPLSDQPPDKGKFRLRRSGKGDFDLLESDFDQKAEKFRLGILVHRLRQGLVAVPEVDAAPYGRRRQRVFAHPIERLPFGEKILPGILAEIFHARLLFVLFLRLSYHKSARKATLSPAEKGKRREKRLQAPFPSLFFVSRRFFARQEIFSPARQAGQIPKNSTAKSSTRNPCASEREGRGRSASAGISVTRPHSRQWA